MNNNYQPGNRRQTPPGGYYQNTSKKSNAPRQNPNVQRQGSGRAQGPQPQNFRPANPGPTYAGQNSQYRPNQQRPQQPRQGAHPQQKAQNTPMSRIGSQSPNQRRAEPNKKIKLTAEQIEINRINRQRERYYIKKRRSAMIRTFVSRFILFLIVFAVMAGFCASAFFLNLTRVESADSSSYSYVIGDKKYSLSYSQAVRDGRVFVSFTDIAEMCDLAVTGSVEDMKYVIKGDEDETIRFVTDSRVVYVNGVETRLGAECFYMNDMLFVPVDFVSAYFKGLTVEVDERAHRVEISREITNLDEDGDLPKGETAVYGELSFLLQSTAAMESLDEEEMIYATLPDLGFVTNLTIYETYMNPGNTMDYLALVNTNNRLDSSYAPQDLMVVSNTRDDGRADQMIREYAAMALEALFKELYAAGYTDVTVTSGYRSYAYQESLFNTYYNNEKAKNPSLSHDELVAKVMAYSQPAGASEHQSGLCVDMHNIETGANVSFGDTDAFRWLEANCWKFGFILRFPADKTELTGISYEPWHYRYVGRYHAQRIYEMGMCLEEYWDYIKAQ